MQVLGDLLLPLLQDGRRAHDQRCATVGRLLCRCALATAAVALEAACSVEGQATQLLNAVVAVETPSNQKRQAPQPAVASALLSQAQNITIIQSNYQIHQPCPLAPRDVLHPARRRSHRFASTARPQSSVKPETPYLQAIWTAPGGLGIARRRRRRTAAAGSGHVSLQSDHPVHKPHLQAPWTAPGRPRAARQRRRRTAATARRSPLPTSRRTRSPHARAARCREPRVPE